MDEIDFSILDMLDIRENAINSSNVNEWLASIDRQDNRLIEYYKRVNEGRTSIPTYLAGDVRPHFISGVAG